MPERSTTLDELAARLDAVANADARRLRKRIRTARRSDEPLDELIADVAAAEAALKARVASLPTPEFPEELPITERLEELLEVIQDNQVVVVAGETGSGKSTQLPKIALALGRGAKGLIGHTQPRRLAARTVAERVAEELGTEVGGPVGYAVRFTDKVGPDTHVKVMTDGILLAEIQRDRRLEAYDTVIIDEAHERSLNIDFLLGYLHRLLPQRPDLKLIITSATIDTERFSEHFGGAPIIEVSGRTYPVEHRYRPIEDQATEEAIADAVEELFLDGPDGDVLVFCAGERDIRDAIRALENRNLGAELLPLYARLSLAEQHKVFAPSGRRRVVVSTNVAETSLTVPGIRSVVDPGLARISRFGRRTKVQRLPIEAISQASANQRSGRCGRLGPGVCIRLFGEEDFEARPEFTEPEILRTNLASVILQMASMRLGDIAEFPFVEPPDRRSIGDGVNLLVELGALDPEAEGTKRWLTPLGRRLARLPVDPRLGRMVLAAEEEACVADVIVIAAALSVRDPRERPTDGAGSKAAALHRRFEHEDSDLLGWLELWDHLRRERRNRSGNQFRRMCREEHLNFLRIREWQDVERQLRETAKRTGIEVGRQPRERTPAHEEGIHRAILTGFISQIGNYDREAREYKGPRNTRFRIGRESVLGGSSPKWVMAAEMVDTGQVWARGAARIQPGWVADAAPHLVKHSHSDPYWDPQGEEAIAVRTTTLYGIQLGRPRTVALSGHAPETAREIFLHHALVEGEWSGDHAFVRHNADVVAELEAHEHRARRSLVTDHLALFDFYDERVPEHVTSGADFDRWWAGAKGRTPALLNASIELLLDDADRADVDDHPDSWDVGGLDVELDYVFTPTAPDDGVNVRVPLAHLTTIDPDALSWQVPGMRGELVEALVRSLPKRLRRHLTPVAEAAADLTDGLEPDGRPLEMALAERVARRIGEPVRPADFDRSLIPEHLHPRWVAIDADGAEVDADRDITALRQRLAGAVRTSVADATSGLERSGLTEWSFGDLPRSVTTQVAGADVEVFPAVADEGATIGVAVLANRRDQLVTHWAGVRRLVRLGLGSQVRPAHAAIAAVDEFAPLHRPHAELGDLLDDLVDAAVGELMGEAGALPWDADAMAELLASVRGGLANRLATLGALVGEALVARGRLILILDELATIDGLDATVADAEEHLARLLPSGFITASGRARLGRLPVYLAALEHRLSKARSDPRRDRSLVATARVLEAEVADADLTLLGPDAPTRRRLGDLLEEFRVSLFAQHLGTAEPVSERRIRRLLRP